MLLRHDRDLGILATDIAHCTVMFCSLSNAGGRNVQTQVGMHAGTAAGAVIGKLGAFYCVYGNTVNMASRLCKSAAAGQVQASMDFMACLEDERGRGVAGRGGELAWHSRGQVS